MNKSNREKNIKLESTYRNVGMLSSFSGMGPEKRLFSMFLLPRKYIISFGVKSLNIVGRESNITSLEEEGLEERLEFLRSDCSEHV